MLHKMDKIQLVEKRKWDGWAEWVLIAGFVIAGINLLRFPLGYSSSDLELTLKLTELACIWGMWKFKRLGFYVFMGLYLLWVLVGIATFLPFVAIASGVRLILASLVVRSRWNDMDPVFRKDQPSEGEQP